MVKKIMRTGLAALTVVSMFATTAMAADWNENGGTSEVVGDAEIINPTIEVELPGDLAFGINPLGLDTDEDGTGEPQIITSDYIITNYSNIPVLVKASTKLTAATSSNVQILTDADYEDNGDLKATADKKAIWLAQLYPTSAATTTADGAKLNVTDITAKQTQADIKGKTITGTDTDMLFKLAAYAETTTGSGITKPECVSGFKFGGAVDPNATFVPEDEIKVTTTFTLNTLSKNQADQNYETFDTGYDATVVKVKAP